MNRFLVLLAAHDGATFIKSQISSVLAQEGVDVAIVVSDDHSTDATRHIVREIAAADPRVVLECDSTAKGSASANFFSLIAQADANGFDFVAFCDQDDYWHSDKLLRAADLLCKSQAAGYSSAVTARWGDGRERVLRQKPLQGAADYLFEGAGQGCTFVMRVDLFDRVRTGIKKYGDALRRVHYHDWAAYAVARTLDLGWVFDPRPSMTYLQHGGNDTGARSSSDGIKRRLALIRNGWYRAQVDAIAHLVLSINPGDVQALRWNAIAGNTVAGRWQRAAFIARRGRRRFVDRGIQLVAALLGYL